MVTAPPAPAVPSASRPRILVVGCGGIGGIVAAHLFEQGHDVTALTTNTVIADAIEANGFVVRGDASPGTVKGTAVRELHAGTRPFDYVLLATQPPQVEQAAAKALPFLAERGAMVCFQNGLCEERVSAIAGADRTFGAIVAWGASMVEPGVYDRTSSGGFVIGRLDGEPDDRLDELGLIIECIGPTTTTRNLAGARWSKLAINCAISSLGTVGGDRLGPLLRQRHVRRLALEIMTETVEVARALDVRLEKVSGTLDLEWIALSESEKTAAGSAGLVAKHALLLAVGARYRRLRSSMLAAIERGRVPAVDFLNGEVVLRGQALGVPTPVNAAVRDQVLRIAAGYVKPSHDLLRQFFERTRLLLESPPSEDPVPAAPAEDPIPASGASAPLDDAAPAAIAPAPAPPPSEPTDPPSGEPAP
jgi:2-dehydropantoate 2-reductase